MTTTQPTLFDLGAGVRRRLARPRPADEPHDVATQAWLDAGMEIRERRRDARRVLMGRALKLAEAEGLTCRDAFRRVRWMYEQGLFSLPANV